MINTKTEKVIVGLTKLSEGYSMISESFSYANDKGELLVDIANGAVGDGFVVDKGQSILTFSFDEESLELSSFVESFVQQYISEFPKVLTTKPNTEYALIQAGFDLAIEGLTEVVEVLKDDDMKENIKSYLPPNQPTNYNPFKLYGFTNYLKHLKVYRKAFLDELKRQIGEVEYKKHEASILA